MNNKPNSDAKRFAAAAIAHIQRSRDFVSESVMEYMALGLLAEQMILADVSVDIAGLDEFQAKLATQQRKGRVFDIYTEAIALVHSHFNQTEG